MSKIESVMYLRSDQQSTHVTSGIQPHLKELCIFSGIPTRILVNFYYRLGLYSKTLTQILGL
jgi:hypothetical protein